MKLVTAIIQPDRLNEVLDALEAQEIHLATVIHVLGRGRQRGVAEVYRGHKEVGSLLRKVKVEVAVNEEFVDRAIEAICSAARTEHIGDGKIFISELHECVRIRTGERGTSAIG